MTSVQWVLVVLAVMVYSAAVLLWYMASTEPFRQMKIDRFVDCVGWIVFIIASAILGVMVKMNS